MNPITEDSRFRDEYNSISLVDREDGVTMCDIYDKIMLRGEEKGVEKGIEKGIEKGRAEGRSEGIIKTLADLVKKGLITVVQAAEQAEMPVSEFKSKAGLTV